ncbi:hypothetical protein [Streptomyces murinus]|uniref:hypothetical protein n=1 Tax=Streptomyces murinus TaxID=33900 RepID=UPI00382CD2AB
MTLVPEESQRLHRLIAYYQVPLGLSQEQQTGTACVWCGSPAGPDAVGLEYPGRRGCPDCYLARIRWLITWYDWQRHALDCTPCQQLTTCHVGRGRRVQHELTIVPACKEPLFCASCRRTVEAGEQVVPVLVEGPSHDHLGYGHTHCLTRRAVTR